MTVLMSMGMGVDSAAIVTRWINDPNSRDFDLADLICVTAMTGDEYQVTAELMHTLMLPALASHRIRYVQVARAGQRTSDGYVVLSDTREPVKMHMAGPWRLSDELAASGTVPQIAGGRRICSLRAKGEVLDAWAADHLHRGYTHVIGYSAEETLRIARDRCFTTTARNPSYPLAEWAWTRADAAGYLHQTYGRAWSRSCCVYCPFQTGSAIGASELLARWRAEPGAAVQALITEYRALALNPRSALLGTTTAHDFARAHQLTAALDAAHAALDAAPWAVYDVRRIYHARHGHPSRKGPAWRAVAALATGTRAAMRRELAAHTAAASAEITTGPHGIPRAWLIRPSSRYPTAEHFLVLGPAGVTDKQRPGFTARWAQIVSAPQMQLFDLSA